MLKRLGLDGDRPADRRFHGGPDQAALCYAAAHYAVWREELGIADIGPGGFGENLTIADQDEQSVCVGDVYQVGEALVEVSKPRVPCYKISYFWRRPDLLERVQQTGRHGWYVRVLQEGRVEAGDELIRVDRRPFAPTVAQAVTLRA